MTVNFHTTVFDVPPSPMGLIPQGFWIRHRCALCWAEVPTAELTNHARSHDGPRSAQEGGAID
ncbi:MAG: hypothetical protein ACT4QB_05435 [Gammaproteobacteria bacterium]